MNDFFLTSALSVALGILLRILKLPPLLLAAAVFTFVLFSKRREIFVVIFFIVLGFVLSFRPNISGLEMLGKVEVYGSKLIISELKVWNGEEWVKIPGKALAKGALKGRVYCKELYYRRFFYPEYYGIDCYDFPLDLSFLDKVKIKIYEKRKEISSINSLSARMIISQSPKEAFDIGMSYIFATSGFHVGVFFLISNLIVSSISFNMWFRIPLSLMITFFLTLYSGPSPSAVRAMLMLSIWSFFKLVDYQIDKKNILGMAALLYLIHNPYLVLSPSFVLSYAGTYGALEALEKGRKWYEFPFIIYVYTLPFALIFFRKIYPLSPVLSLIISPVASVMIFIGAVGAFLNLIGFQYVSKIVFLGASIIDPFIYKIFNLSKVIPLVTFPYWLSFVLSSMVIWVVYQLTHKR